ncbi:MAG: hypothetical protein RMJ39_07805 [Deltaproteobacteria bacterium]|nr:hypothetical protein [Deltaproteobacteria bacterium]
MCLEAERRFGLDPSFVKKGFLLKVEKEDLDSARLALWTLEKEGYIDPEVLSGAILLYSINFELEALNKYYKELQKMLFLPEKTFPENYLEIRQRLNKMGKKSAYFP